MCNSAQRGCLGCLTSGIGVNLGIQNENIDISAAGENMVKSAKADVISPAISADNPLNSIFSPQRLCHIHSEAKFRSILKKGIGPGTDRSRQRQGYRRRRGRNFPRWSCSLWHWQYTFWSQRAVLKALHREFPRSPHRRRKIP